MSEFFVANIAAVPALALEHSKIMRYRDDYFLEERRGLISNLIRPVLRSEALIGHDVVRLEEYQEAVFVSPLFKRVFEDGGFTGYSFKAVETL